MPLRRLVLPNHLRAEGGGKLGDRVDPAPSLGQGLFLRHAPQQAEVVPLDGLGSAAAPVLAYLAMGVQDHLRGGPGFDLGFQPFQRLASLDGQPGQAARAMDLHPGCGRTVAVDDFDERCGLAQCFGEDDPVQGGEQGVLPGNLVLVQEEDRHVERLLALRTRLMSFERLTGEDNSQDLDRHIEDQLAADLDRLGQGSWSS